MSSDFSDAFIDKRPPVAKTEKPTLDSFKLTPAQRRVAEGVLKGLSNAEIAKSLFLSEQAVRTHLTAIYRETVKRGGRREFIEQFLASESFIAKEQRALREEIERLHGYIATLERLLGQRVAEALGGVRLSGVSR